MSLIHVLHKIGATFLGDEGREDSMARPSQHTYLAESSAEMSAERSRQLATQRKKAMKSVQPRGQEKSKKEFKSRKHILESLHKPGIRLTLHITMFCTVLQGYSKVFEGRTTLA